LELTIVKTLFQIAMESLTTLPVGGVVSIKIDKTIEIL